jgi:hypothetical protein
LSADDILGQSYSLAGSLFAKQRRRSTRPSAATIQVRDCF